MADTSKPRSDLGVRTASGVVMMVVAGGAVWLGGWPFTIFVIAVGAGVIWEWWGLASKIAKTPFGAAVWLAAGVSYVGFAMAVLVGARGISALMALTPLLIVIAVDVGAYFAGRTIGGPKIAPRISPSKTWAGLIGGAVAAVLMLRILVDIEVAGDMAQSGMWLVAIPLGAAAAIIAQAGDFFESWMKRTAGVKDSSNLIPGHGGLFDRVDGLLAVLFVFGALYVVNTLDTFALTPSPG